MSEFHGIIPPLLTPRTESGELDREGTSALVDHLVDSGVHGIFVLGSSGEVPYLTASERDQVLETALEAANGRVPILVGISEQTTGRVLDEADRLLSIGGDAAVVTTPLLRPLRCRRDRAALPHGCRTPRRSGLRLRRPCAHPFQTAP
ncbi:dihydrodipicolinate synthase family protein [Brevibacterium aurantiacum]|uniref:dihydrodipicolinate synthase family protein n=1 Tax=Brevibacterium aurantiacum TaxID=273384 RepID=UPI0028C40A27|nr:dihydrodipicolinate synthase family protein [Brevibacterium aurantiacum]